jgi:hypothetical protein
VLIDAGLLVAVDRRGRKVSSRRYLAAVERWQSTSSSSARAAGEVWRWSLRVPGRRMHYGFSAPAERVAYRVLFAPWELAS